MIGRKNPSITVGIPFYNAEKTLGNAIRSVFAQTFEDWELILIDDGSMDHSAEIARSIRDPRVRVVTDGRHLTLASRLNEIARKATAPYLARMDSDDLMHPERLERQIGFLESNRRTDIVGAGISSIDSYLRPWGKRALSFRLHSRLSVLLGGLLAHPTVMGRTSWFLKYPYCEEDWAVRIEDYELWVRTCGNTVFGHIPEILLFYREDAGEALARLESSHRSALCMFRRRKEIGLGLWETGMARIIWSVKMGVNRAAMLVGGGNWLISRRNIPLSYAEYESFRNTITAILNTPVPGL